MPWSLAFVVGSLLAPRLARRAAPVSIFVGGLAVSALGFALLAFGLDSAAGLGVVVASTVLMSLGMAPVFTVGNEMIITSAPPERAGAASALSETASEFSAALGVAVFGSIGTLLYRLALAETMPAATPAGPAAAALATLGNAVAAADAMAGPAGDALRLASRAAFVDAMQVAAGVGAVLMLGASALSAWILGTAGAPRRGRAAARDAV